MKALLTAIVLILATTVSFAQIKAGKTNRGPYYAKMIKAGMERVLPSDDGDTVTRYHFLVQWRDDAPPTAFFWRGKDGWMTCLVSKGSAKGWNKQVGKGKEIHMNDIHKNTMLTITPVAGGKFKIPAEIPKSAKNRLYFQTAKGAWEYLPVKKFEKTTNEQM